MKINQKVKSTKVRRDFFKMIGAGAAGAAIFSFLPFKLFSGSTGKSKAHRNKITVDIHPLAIKKNNKG